jgi:2-amino-4-hydroxy-6-hydroxymethyldihydropteridine diphosphokinase
MSSAFIGLGSNLGNRERKLEEARGELAKLGQVVRCSSVYETKPWQVGTQPLFLNQVCELETETPPAQLLKKLLQAERRLGRRRLYRGEPRTIDIDLLFYGDQIVDRPAVQVPHPRAAERAFVLVPLVEIASGLRHPVLGVTVDELLAKADASGVRKV